MLPVKLDNSVRPVLSTNPDYLQFLGNARDVVNANKEKVGAMIAAKTLPEGKWHPNGFATFNIENVEGLGLLRLHFWPRGLRRVLPSHPSVHTHCFRLYSDVLAGQYKDSQFDVADVDAPDGEKPALARIGRKYVIRYAQPDGYDLIEDTGQWSSITPRDLNVVYPAGSWHEMENGLYHATPIAKSQFCATLVIITPKRDGAEDILVGNPNFGTTRHVRPLVTPEEAELMCSQFLQATRAQELALPDSVGALSA